MNGTLSLSVGEGAQVLTVPADTVQLLTKHEGEPVGMDLLYLSDAIAAFGADLVTWHSTGPMTVQKFTAEAAPQVQVIVMPMQV
jgi:DNA polymerase III sliding clamp (beta) subunit (PCNA family)